MRAGKSARAVEHPPMVTRLPGTFGRAYGADRLDGVERRSRGLAAGTERPDHGRDDVHRRWQGLADHQGAGKAGHDGQIKGRASVRPSGVANVADIDVSRCLPSLGRCEASIPGMIFDSLAMTSSSAYPAP